MFLSSRCVVRTRLVHNRRFPFRGGAERRKGEGLVPGTRRSRRQGRFSNPGGWRVPGALAAALAACALAPAAAGAALPIQPNDPFLGFPASVTDDVTGVALGPCQDATGFCLETPAPNLAAALSVPDNFTPDGEAFYNEADATVPGAGLGLAL